MPTPARGAATLLLLLPCCCLAAQARNDDCAQIAAAARIAEVGAFSNMRFTEEHAYGYTVMLWRAGKCIFGLFESSEGLAGDTPVGELRDVRYDGKKGTLSFSAKLTTGLASVEGGFEPSRDRFTFDGRLRATRLEGNVTRANRNHRDFEPTRSRVVLRRWKEGAEGMHGPATYAEWREKWQPVLQARGPKW